MIFTLAELEHHPIQFDLEYAPGEIGLADEIRQIGPLKTRGKAELLRNTLGEIRLRGHLSVELSCECVRCLEAANFPLDQDYDLFYRPPVEVGNHAEIHLEEGEVDISFYEGDRLALEEAMREFILLSIPMQVFCSPDCKGLCPVCGINRNRESCSCKIERTSARWEALKRL